MEYVFVNENENGRPYVLLLKIYLEMYRPATRTQPEEGGEFLIEEAYLLNSNNNVHSGNSLLLSDGHRLIPSESLILEELEAQD